MTPAYTTDILHLADGRELSLKFFKHASFAINIEGKWIYNDPVSDFADYTTLEKADLILVGHHHYDHLDIKAIRAILKSDTQILCDKTSATMLLEEGIKAKSLNIGELAEPFSFLKIEATAAYNTTEGHQQFHPKEREDIGFILNYGSTRLYIAGDGERTDEMLSIKGVDIAFLPVNQPYTMTVEDAVLSVKSLKPKIFYPYHYGQVEEVTDLERLQRELHDVCEVRIRGME